MNVLATIYTKNSLKTLLIISLVLIGFISNAQTPDTLQLSPKELFGESDDWNDIGILQSYIDFSKDVLSSSNLSIGIIGKQVSTTLNLGYSKSSARHMLIQVTKIHYVKLLKRFQLN